jgi:hypothetical protein
VHANFGGQRTKVSIKGFRQFKAEEEATAWIMVIPQPGASSRRAAATNARQQR